MRAALSAVRSRISRAASACTALRAALSAVRPRHPAGRVCPGAAFCALPVRLPGLVLRPRLPGRCILRSARLPAGPRFAAAFLPGRCIVRSARPPAGPRFAAASARALHCALCPSACRAPFCGRFSAVRPQNNVVCQKSIEKRSYIWYNGG